MLSRNCLAAGIFAVLVPNPSLLADATPQFSFADPTVRIPAGAVGWTAEITLKSDVQLPDHPEIADPAQNAAIAFLWEEEKPGPTNAWHYAVRFTGAAPSSQQMRYVVVKYGNPAKTQMISYTLTSSSANFSWSIAKPADPWVWSRFRRGETCTEFVVTPKDSMATGLRVNSTLVEQTTKAPISTANLSLCRLGKGGVCNSSELELAANTPATLQLCIMREFHGNYHGTVTLISTQKPDGDVILQAALFSSILARSIGFAIICLGVALGWLAKVWARSLTDRDQALLPAALMTSQLAVLEGDLEQVPSKYLTNPCELRQRIGDLLGELSESVLDAHSFLPPGIPSFGAYNVDAAGYKSYLEARNPPLLYYSILIKQGIEGALAEDDGHLQPAEQTLIRQAIIDLDQMSAILPVPSVAIATQTVQGRLTSLHGALHPVAAVAAEAIPVGLAAPLQMRQIPDLQSLQIEIGRINGAVWIIYGVLTALSGFAVLILNNPGFGVPLDYVLAFFWGFGLPTTVSALTPASASTALNISVPKG